jgi:hypothetical protein
MAADTAVEAAVAVAIPDLMEGEAVGHPVGASIGLDTCTEAERPRAEPRWWRVPRCPRGRAAFELARG